MSEREQFSRHFMEDLIKLLKEFRDFQLDNTERHDITPYSYDLLGFMEWLEFEKGYDL